MEHATVFFVHPHNLPDGCVSIYVFFPQRCGEILFVVAARNGRISLQSSGAIGNEQALCVLCGFARHTATLFSHGNGL